MVICLVLGWFVDDLTGLCMVCGWFVWFVGGLTGFWIVLRFIGGLASLWVVESFTANALINTKTIIRRNLAVFEANLGILLIPGTLKSSYNSKDKNTIQTLNSFPFKVAQ